MIRKAKLEDCDKLDQLLTLLIRDEVQYDKTIDPGFMVIKFYENFVNDPNRCLLVAEENNEIVGYLYGFKQQKDPVSDKKEYLLDALYVDPNYRHQGIGSALIDEFKTWCLESNATCITVNVCSENKEAKELYKNNNFVTTKETMIMELK